MSTYLQKDSGVVAWVGSKKRGSRVYWSFKLEDGDTFYRTRTVNPQIKKGDMVAFEYEDGEYGCQVDLETLVVKESSTTQGKSTEAAAKGSSNKGTSKGSSRDEYWNKKAEDDKIRQDIISYQAATNSAIAYVSKAVEFGAISLGAANAKAAVKEEAFREAVLKKSEEFYADFLSAPVLAADIRANQKEDDAASFEEAGPTSEGDNLDE